MKLAHTKAKFDASSEFGGYIERVRKRQIDFIANGKPYTMNAHRVLCLRSTDAQGRIWYTYLNSRDELFGSCRESADFIEQHAEGRDHIGLFFSMRALQEKEAA